MALLCGLTLALPFQVMGSLTSDYFDQLKEHIEACPGHLSHGLTYSQARVGFKSSLTFAVYSSVAGMVFSTFYFLFKRHQKKYFTKWRRKARFIVLLIFVSTCVAMSSNMYLMTLLLRWFLVDSNGILCSTSQPTSFYTVIIFMAGIFLLSIYLVY